MEKYSRNSAKPSFGEWNIRGARRDQGSNVRVIQSCIDVLLNFLGFPRQPERVLAGDMLDEVKVVSGGGYLSRDGAIPGTN